MPKNLRSGAPKKARWTSDQKAAAKKGPKKAHRGQSAAPSAGKTYAARPARDGDRRSERPERTDRPARGYDRSERPARSYDRSERPARSYDRSERPARSYDRSERPARSYDRDDRAPRRFDRDDNRGQRRDFNRDDRPQRRESTRDDRPARRSDRSENRGPRQYNREDRPVTSFNRDDNRGPRREFDRSDRPARSYDRSDRPARSFDRSDRPARSYDRDDNRGPRREFDRSDRPARSYDRNDRPARSYDRDDNRGPRREFDRSDRPARRFDRDDRPARGFDAQVDPEAERMEADTWVKATRKSIDGPVIVEADNGFAGLGLADRLVERLARDGITTPFPIQAATIPDALAGKDVLGRGQTGSGKTLAFGLPMLSRLADGQKSAPRRPRALVLVPTRELAMQVSDALEPLVHVMGLRHKLVAGGLSYTTQINALNRGVDVLIATPGRLKDLIEREAVQLQAVEIAVLDEADHMADMGFMPEVTAILDEMPAGGQRLLFSATLDKGVDKLVEGYLTDPVTHSTDDAKASVTTMEHHVLLIDPMHKKTITAEVANRSGRTVVFVRTKLGADRVALQLREQGVFAAALHGGLNQGARNRVLGAFRDGSLPVLVATDVAARGIHVDDVSVVLQVDPPADHKDYLHRSGRTARAGDKGTVVTLALPHQRRTMERMAREAGIDAMPTKAVPGDERLAATGAVAPSGVPVPEDQVRRVLEAPKRGGRPSGGHRGGPRGPRQGGPRSYRDDRSGGSRGDRASYSRSSRG
ncbi:Superfamily II DNA and RNA helicase [Pedococcus dokdonensis]|uniref:Superfamily II DNA and RNA helicase n=1 Tax=Pedococcus dokdonensis TaxID=443156 RepID=A0A1H0QUP1_9MICO|nr:DEAD/DEAH box helicase [Pedococcus dokdonensis]SDP21023.1 Superfamily II DNA and RNA helicase [Pedococcus dokdonensis]